MMKRAIGKFFRMVFWGGIVLGFGCTPPGKPVSFEENELLEISLKNGGGYRLNVTNPDGGLNARDVMVVILEQEDRVLDLGPGQIGRVVDEFRLEIAVPSPQLTGFHPGPATLLMIVSDPVTGHLVHIYENSVHFVE